MSVRKTIYLTVDGYVDSLPEAYTIDMSQYIYPYNDKIAHRWDEALSYYYDGSDNWEQRVRLLFAVPQYSVENGRLYELSVDWALNLIVTDAVTRLSRKSKLFPLGFINTPFDSGEYDGFRQKR